MTKPEINEAALAAAQAAVAALGKGDAATAMLRLDDATFALVIPDTEEAEIEGKPIGTPTERLNACTQRFTRLAELQAPAFVLFNELGLMIRRASEAQAELFEQVRDPKCN